MTPEIIYNLKYALSVPGTAIISPDTKYRYTLTREWNKKDNLFIKIRDLKHLEFTS